MFTTATRQFPAMVIINSELTQVDKTELFVSIDHLPRN